MTRTDQSSTSKGGSYRPPGYRHFVTEIAPGDDGRTARLRNRVGTLHPLTGIDNLLGQAVAQPDAVAEATYQAALEAFESLWVGAEAGRRALTAFAESRGFEPPADTGSDPEAIRRTVEGEKQTEIDTLKARIAELEREKMELEELLTASGDAEPASEPNDVSMFGETDAELVLEPDPEPDAKPNARKKK